MEEEKHKSGGSLRPAKRPFWKIQWFQRNVHPLAEAKPQSPVTGTRMRAATGGSGKCEVC